MKVILTEEVERLGDAGTVAEVKDGYARNFLLPRKLALAANRSNMSVYEEVKRQRQAQNTRAKREAEGMAKRLEKASCTVAVSVGEEDRIFGSVTGQQIGDLLRDQGFEIDRRDVQLDEPIRSLGVYDVAIQLHPEVAATVKVWVVKE